MQSRRTKIYSAAVVALLSFGPVASAFSAEPGAEQVSDVSVAGNSTKRDVSREPRGTFDNPIMPAVQHDVKVVYQIKTDSWKNDVAAGLHYLDKLAKAYDALEIAPADRQIIGVFHGDAGYFLVNDAAYERATGKAEPNPNAQIVARLLHAGVRLELCRSTMKSHGWTGDDMLPGVEVVVGAYPRVIDLQLQGYAYIRF